MSTTSNTDNQIGTVQTLETEMSVSKSNSTVVHISKVSVDEDPQSGLLEAQSLEYQSITDEDQGSSTKSSRDAAEAIPPDTAMTGGLTAAAMAMTADVPLANEPNEAEKDNSDKVDKPAMEDTPSKIQRKQLEYTRHLLQCCEDGDGFDYYQIMAFYSNTKDNLTDSVKYVLCVIKALICALTQLLGMVIIMVDFVVIGLEERGDAMCNVADFGDAVWYQVLYDFQLKILAFLFSTFLAFICFDRLTGVEQGMYWKMKYAQNIDFLNIMWLRIGFSVNVFASILAVYGSFMVVFFSDNSLDMILNSVALFFVVELDDLLVKGSDYQRIGDYIQQHLAKEEEEQRKKMSEAPDAAEGKCCSKAMECGKACCSSLVCCVAWLYTLPFQALRYFTIAMCVVLPFMLGYCY